MGLPKARAAVAKALELDKSLAEAHAILAYIRLVYDRDDEAGEKEFRRAIELNPNDSTTLRFYGASLLHLGRFGEAEAAVRQALEIDPLSLVINTLLMASIVNVNCYFISDLSDVDDQLTTVTKCQKLKRSPSSLSAYTEIQ